MVTFHDGATIAQASPPSMKLPISMALDWPRRVSGAQPALDFRESMSWTFEPVDNKAFPAVELARLAVEKQGSYAAAYNAANEEAAAAFLGSRIRFPEIVDTVATVLNEDSFVAQPRDFLDVLEAEKLARQRAQEYLSSVSR